MTDTYPESLNCDIHTHYCIAKADTGASNHYWMKKNGNVLKNVTLAPGPSVQLPNSELIHSTARGEIPLPKELSQDAKNTMILPKLTSSNLISLGQLCDDDCEIILNKNIMKAMKNNKVILEGYRNKKDGLWDIPITKTGITTKCCIPPKSHSSLYPARTSNSPIADKINRKNKANHCIPRHLQQLSELATSSY